jgi:branched-chain amino acid transport system substrate-binding protein
MTRKLLRQSLLVALACTTLVAASSCGSSKPAASTSGGASTGGRTAAEAGSRTFTLGLLTSVTGALADNFGPTTVAAAKARIDLANDTHEVPGVTFKLAVQDDQSTPTGALAGTQILINQDHVLAILDGSSFFAAAYKYTVQQKVPVLGWADSTEFSDPANTNLFSYYGSAATSYPPIKNLGLFLQSQGVTKLCRVGIKDVPAAITTADQIAGSAQAVGINVVYKTDLPLTQTDLSPVALAIKSSGCDGLGAIMTNNGYVALVQDLANLGVHMKGSYGGTYNDLALDKSTLAAVNGYDYLSQYQPFWMQTPASERVSAALSKYAGENIPVTGAPPQGMFWGWLPADLAVYGVGVSGGASVTQASFITDLRKVTNYDAGGYICPVDLSKFDYVLAGPYSSCVYMSKLTNGQFGPPANFTEPVKLSN